MNIEKLAIRALIRHYWKKDLNSSATTSEICNVEGKGVVAKHTVQEWFSKFKNGETSLEEKARSCRPSLQNDEISLETLDKEPHFQHANYQRFLGLLNQRFTF